MTRKERALKTLKQMRYGGRYAGTDILVPLEVLEDFEMAIQALGKESCGDAVSREDVKYAIKPYIQEIITESGVDKNEHTNRTIRAILNTIETIPSVQSKSSWIPIDKQKPEDHQLIWFTDNYGCVDKGEVIYGYTKLEGGVNGRRFDRNEIVAWMPINKPEPYKVESSETERELAYADQDTMVPAT